MEPMKERRDIDFVEEARQNLKEVEYALSEGYLSTVHPNGTECVHINLTTLEGNKFCVRLSRMGFEVVGTGHDVVTEDSSQVFETVYALMNHISPGYQSAFHSKLASKLGQVSQSRDET